VSFGVGVLGMSSGALSQPVELNTVKLSVVIPVYN
jgi:hypothetical protein